MEKKNKTDKKYIYISLFVNLWIYGIKLIWGNRATIYNPVLIKPGDSFFHHCLRTDLMVSSGSLLVLLNNWKTTNKA